MTPLDTIIAAVEAAAPMPLKSAEAHKLVGEFKARKALMLLVHGGHAVTMRDIVGHGSLYFRHREEMAAFLAAHPRPGTKRAPPTQAKRHPWRAAA